MRTDYKRDINGNYLLLYEEEELDTSSYQMRMLVGNTIPSVLKCRVQGIDGQFMVCFDITSKQSLASLFEEKKIGYQDLKMILSGFVQVMEEMAEYLLNPGRILLKPDYMYADLEKRQLYFCYLPGYEEDVRQKFQELTEYILPKLDHEDANAVMLGYSVYRLALEDSFHLDYIKKELYQERNAMEKEEPVLEKNYAGRKTEFQDVKEILSQKNENEIEEEKLGKILKRNLNADLNESLDENLNKKFMEDPDRQDQLWSTEEERPKKKKTGILIWGAVAAVLLLTVFIASTLGYLPQISVEILLAVCIGAMAAGMFGTWLVSRVKKPGNKREKSPGEKENIKERAWDLQSENLLQKEDAELWKEESQQEKKIRKSEKISLSQKNFGETVVLSANIVNGPAMLVSREPGELATIYLQEELVVIGKMENAADVVVDIPTVSRIHAKIRRRDGEYYLTDLNSRNGTSVNGKMLRGNEDYCLQDQDEVDFAQARYVFLNPAQKN